ncbi:(deoxy)nucleoside triphosphate pyrophosphohydrolase [bacterium]|nr:(deoxy)nucleoside triphosphate pyrophosphohydrolase [bacterium]
MPGIDPLRGIAHQDGMTEVVCGVIEDERGRFLACLRPQDKHLGGLWEFPGGKVEPGESAESALVRELREELGIEVVVGAPLQPVNWCYQETEIRLRPFRCRIIGGELRALEHERLLWCAPADFDDLAWAAADVPVWREIQAHSGGELAV